MKLLVSFVAGVLFALGLGVAGMTLPSKVFGFLDFAGAWDPTLAFVMIGAILVNGAFFWLLRGNTPVLAPSFLIPTRLDVDRRLIAGALLFGIGWGLSGLCPGPALTSLATRTQPIIVFVAAMVAGMYAFKLVERLIAPANKD